MSSFLDFRNSDQFYLIFAFPNQFTSLSWLVSYNLFQTLLMKQYIWEVRIYIATIKKTTSEYTGVLRTLLSQHFITPAHQGKVSNKFKGKHNLYQYLIKTQHHDAKDKAAAATLARLILLVCRLMGSIKLAASVRTAVTASASFGSRDRSIA